MGILVGVWGALPRFVSPELNVADSKEVADHVVPALVVIALSVAALVSARSGVPGMLMFVSGLAVCLAGVWMVATHVPLVAQAARGEPGVTWSAAVWHSSAAAAVAVLGIVWVATYWDAASD